MKYKVGDKVRVRIDLVPYEVYGSLTFLDGNMSKCAGQICTIMEVLSDKKYYVSENPFAWSEEMLEPADSKTLRMADGTVIGEFNAGGVLPTSEWSKLIFKNGSSIEVLPQKDDTVRGKNHFCDGFRGGKIPTPSEPISITDQLDSLADAWSRLGCTSFQTATDVIDRLLKKSEEKNLKFTFYVTEGYRVDKSNNTKIPTITTEVLVNGKDYQYGGCATCDKADYSERDGILNAIANAVCCGNFDREYEKFLADKKRRYDESCKCKICGRNYYEDEKTGKRTPFTPEDARKHEEWHEQNKKNKREKYLIRKEAKRRLAEAEREGKIEQTMKELYKK